MLFESGRARKISATLLALLLALPLWGETRVFRDGDAWVEETTGTLPASRNVRVSTSFGSVHAEGDGPKFTYTIRKRCYAKTEAAARKQFEHFRVSATRGVDAIVVEGRAASNDLKRFSVDFMLSVPRELDALKVDTGSGSLFFHSFSGTLVAKTIAGPIDLDNILGTVYVKSGGGDVNVGTLGGDFTLMSGAGNVHITAVNGVSHLDVGGGTIFLGFTKGGVIKADSGGITVQKCLGDLKATTGGGNMMLGDIAGNVELKTGAGWIRVGSAQGHVLAHTGGGAVALQKLSQGADVETGGGPITVEFANMGRNGFRDSMLHTAAGDITVFLPGNIGVAVHATSDLSQGKGITSDFSGLKISQEGTFGPHSAYAEGSLNGGGPPLRVRTTMGAIQFKRE